MLSININEYSLVVQDPIVQTIEIEKSGNDICKMFLDGVSSKYGSGIEIVFVAPSSENHVLYFKLGFETTNNVAKYEALILGLEVAKK